MVERCCVSCPVNVNRRKCIEWCLDRVCVWMALGGGRKRGRPATRWEDELEKFAAARGQKWEECALDLILWESSEADFLEFGVEDGGSA